MRIVAIKYKPREVSGKCNANSCNNPCSCFWRGRKVCSLHYFELQRFERNKRKQKNRMSPKLFLSDLSFSLGDKL